MIASVFGVLFDTAVGAAGPILNMAGLQLYNLFDNSGGLILNVTLNVILVPEFHGLGAAVATTFVDRAWVVRRHGSRGLDLTADGAVALEEWLGVRLTDDAAWRDSA